MAMVSIMEDESTNECFTIHPEVAELLGIDFDKGDVQFSLHRAKVCVIVDEKINRNKVYLTNSIIHELKIPMNCDFEIRIEGKRIIIGPFIGLLCSNKEEAVKRKVKGFSSYVKYYAKIGGSILAFSLEGIDKNNRTIRGFMYNPKRKKWQEGTFAYPSGIFKMIALNKSWREYFYSVLGNRMFNSNFTNKWKMHKYLSQFPEVNAYLPKTELYTAPENILNFLEEHRELYVKPLTGCKGKGIYYVAKEDDKVIVQARKNGTNVKKQFDYTDDAVTFFKSNFRKKRYILQQAIDTRLENDRRIDFRLVLMKDNCGEWKDLGLIGKHGLPGSVVSNRVSGAKVDKGEWVFQNVLHLTSEEAQKFREEFTKVATTAAKALDQSDMNFGRLGIDITIDCNRNIWIIEMNNRQPTDYIGFHVGMRHLLYDIRLANMMYAKRLAGFHE